MERRTGKVVVIGAGFVGSTAAYALLIEGAASEIILIDRHKEKAEGEAMDLRHGLQFKANSRITYGDDYALCKDAEIVIICAGAHQEKGETRLDLVKKNSLILKDAIKGITTYNKDCILIIISNPVDVLTRLAIRYSKFPPSKVFSTGTMLDTARFRFLLGEHFGVSPESVHAYILGEHGDSSFAVWSAANIAGVPLVRFKGYNRKKMEEIYLQVKNAAYEVISRKGATYYAIGLVVSRLVKAILSDQNRVFALSTLLRNYQGVSDVCLSVPCIVNREGIKEHIVIPFNASEKKRMEACALVMRKAIKDVLAG